MVVEILFIKRGKSEGYKKIATNSAVVVLGKLRGIDGAFPNIAMAQNKKIGILKFRFRTL